MQAKSLRDFDEYTPALKRLEILQAEHTANRERQAAIDAEVTSKNSPTARHRLYQERQQLEQREPALLEELEAARQELDPIRGRLSLQLCKPMRPQFIEEIKKIKSAIQQILEANRRLIALRDSLERDGIATGSIGPATCAIGGSMWTEEFPLVGYLRQVAEAFPELR